MTPAEIVASFMEERPEKSRGQIERDGLPAPEWWVEICGEWKPLVRTLDRLRLVEERLNAVQCRDYDRLLLVAVTMQCSTFPGSYQWHASADQKMAALAEVLRGVAEKLPAFWGLPLAPLSPPSAPYMRYGCDARTDGPSMAIERDALPGDKEDAEARRFGR